jgi:hypothetical protein
MGMQLAEKHEAPVWQIYPIIQTVSGFDGARLVTALSDNKNTLVAGFNLWSNAMVGVSLGGTYFAGTGDYDTAFVESVLQADAAAPEANFNNVVDMLDWLNRE